MGHFELYLEGQRRISRQEQYELDQKKLAEMPDSVFIQKIREALAERNGIISWNKMQQMLYIKVDRFNKIIKKMIQDKEIEIRNLTTTTFNRTVKYIISYGTNANIDDETKLDRGYYNQEARILNIITNQSGNTTFANVDWEAKMSPSFPQKDSERRDLIKQILKGLELKKLITLKYVKNKFRIEPAIWIELVKPEQTFRLDEE